MKVGGVAYRTIWPDADGAAVSIIDQRKLPHKFEVVQLNTADAAARAIREMWVRGAPLIGATAAWGLWLAARRDPSDGGLQRAYDLLFATRPTAINLRWALDKVMAALRSGRPGDRAAIARDQAAAITEDDVATCKAIGAHGLVPIRSAWERAGKARPVHILTHCNAGWLATVDYGTALSPIYQAHDAGIPIEVWVDETRPRNQGASLTAWELKSHGVPYAVIPDNAGGHLMQKGQVDLCIVGTDRTTARGDVCNKIGTYLKALAAKDNGVPFYVALPHSTIDWTLDDGLREIPIEERDAREVTHLTGKDAAGDLVEVQLVPDGSAAGNPAFDVTPARLVTALITERGLCPASRDGLLELYPERRRGAA